MTSKPYDPAAAICQCHHTPGYLIEEISNGRPLQKFQENATSQYELVCLICMRPRDHTATDWLIETVMAPERAPIKEPLE